MKEVVCALPCTVFTFGGQVQRNLEIAMESEDLSEIQELLKHAAGAMNAIMHHAQAAQAEIDGESSTQEEGDRDSRGGHPCL